jgi:hypothetical protein
LNAEDNGHTAVVDWAYDNGCPNSTPPPSPSPPPAPLPSIPYCLYLS